MDDALLADLIHDAIAEVRTHLHYGVAEDLPSGCVSIVKALVSIRANQLGNEGLASYGAAGVSESYLTDLPEDLKRRLNSYRRLP